MVQQAEFYMIAFWLLQALFFMAVAKYNKVKVFIAVLLLCLWFPIKPWAHLRYKDQYLRKTWNYIIGDVIGVVMLIALHNSMTIRTIVACWILAGSVAHMLYYVYRAVTIYVHKVKKVSKTAPMIIVANKSTSSLAQNIKKALRNKYEIDVLQDTPSELTGVKLIVFLGFTFEQSQEFSQRLVKPKAIWVGDDLVPAYNVQMLGHIIDSVLK